MTELLQQIVNGLVIGLSYALIAAGLTMIFGLMDIINFAHGEFYMLGAFMAFLMLNTLGMPFALGLVLAILLVMLIGAIFYYLTLKHINKADLTNTCLITIGLSIFLSNIALIIWGPVPRTIMTPFLSQPINIGPVFITQGRLFSIIMTIVIIIIAHYVIQYTKAGRVLRATFQDKDAAALVGVNINIVYFITFVIGIGMAGAAGMFLGVIFPIYPSMGILAVGKAFIVVIMGGMGNFLGAIFAGLILGVAEGLSSGYISSSYKDAIGFIIVILVLLFRPNGLFGKG